MAKGAQSKTSKAASASSSGVTIAATTTATNNANTSSSVPPCNKDGKPLKRCGLCGRYVMKPREHRNNCKLRVTARRSTGEKAPREHLRPNPTQPPQNHAEVTE